MKKPVLVLGGGIAGIQASLDLAEMNIPVFLVENSPSIGGRMAQLDKTFPTNDCSACILAPKVTSCYNHPLVKTFTWSELVEIRGEAPDFTAVIRKRARYIDEDLCKGCGACTLKCPVSVKSEFEMGLDERRAVFKPYAQAVPNIVAIEKKGTSPCKNNCPAHLDANGHVALSGQGRFDEALQLIRRTTPFAGVLGRVCDRNCQSHCYRQHVDSPVNIADLERFVSDYEADQGKAPKFKKEKPRGKKVAVAGSGPAGLNCAYQLALDGYQVTVFEAKDAPGGALRYGIPEFRLDRKVLDREIQIIADLGVEIRLNTRIGTDLTLDELKAQGYSAFFLAIGAQKDKESGIPGEELPGVMTARKFLEAYNRGISAGIGKRVVVLGNARGAVDAARTARRLGSEVIVVFSGSESDLESSADEIKKAMEEGVRFAADAGDFSISCKNGALLLSYNVPMHGREYSIEADSIITAAGRAVDMVGLSRILGISPSYNEENAAFDMETLAAGIPGVFIGIGSAPAGDLAYGAAGIADAVAMGNRAARSIYNYLEGANISIKPYILPQTPVEKVNFRHAMSRNVSRSLMTCSAAGAMGLSGKEPGIASAEEAKEAALRCLNCSVCAECRACERVCPPKAIRHEQTDEIIEVEVSSVIMAPGFDTAAEIPDMYGYGRYPDVVTSLEYERILSASGPFKGHVQRPSDGKAPQRIAFLQCVGSRDEKCSSSYCSAVCCMYAVKEAVITKEHLPSVRDIDIFYMDIRAYGKDFDKYVDSARSKHGIGFVKSRVAEVAENKESGRLVIRYSDANGNTASQEYDMVVLSVGLKPKDEVGSLLEKARVKTDRHGFSWVNEMSAPNTSRNGILACGASAGPKDIPETVVEAGAAAAEASRISGSIEVEPEVYRAFFKPVESAVLRDVSGQPLRIGVFVCHCGTNIAGFLDVKEVVRYAKTLPFVAYARDFMYTCSVDTQKAIAETIVKQNLNRVVVAACTPRTHEPLFQSVLSKAGLNPALVRMANIRDQCSWVHMDRYEEATTKAKDLVKMAVGSVMHAKPLTRQQVEVTKGVLVLGGGMSGLTAALETAGMGYRVHLVEKSGSLGGNAAKLAFSSSGRYYAQHIQMTIDSVLNHLLIEVCLDTEIKQIDGYVGNFTTTLSTGGVERKINHGAVIVATGARERKPDSYCYGDSRSIITQMELEELLKNGSFRADKVRNIVMIQCVGSRDEERPYCSRVCCSQAVKNAIMLKEMNPELNIIILYRDIRTYGLYEAEYARARAAGVQFIGYEPESRPEVRVVNGSIAVDIREPVLGETFSIAADMLVLSAAMEPNTDENRKLAQMLKVPLNQDGFFLEAHAKLRPVEFATEGVYLCGLAHSPKNMKECIVQAKAAAARAATVISRDILETEGTTAHVSADDCTGCGTCEKVCAYKAITIEEVRSRQGTVSRKASINPILCKGCGTCSASCRCGAIDVNGFSDRQVINEIEYLLRRA